MEDMSQTTLEGHMQKHPRNSLQSGIIPLKDLVSFEQNPSAAICISSFEGLRGEFLLFSQGKKAVLVC